MLFVTLLGISFASFLFYLFNKKLPPNLEDKLHTHFLTAGIRFLEPLVSCTVDAQLHVTCSCTCTVVDVSFFYDNPSLFSQIQFSRKLQLPERYTVSRGEVVEVYSSKRLLETFPVAPLPRTEGPNRN